MYFQKRGEIYSFIYYDHSIKKNVRLKRSETPQVKTDEEAAHFCRFWDSKMDASKSRIKRRLEWQTRFHNFKDLLLTYEKSHREEAPYSWAADRNYLEYYVFPFFLEKKGVNNINLWSHHFEEFRDFLVDVPPIKQKLKRLTLAYATKNMIIKALNTFLAIMKRRNIIERAEKCRYFSKSKLHRKNEESVLSSEQQGLIFETLKTYHALSSVFFWVSLHTGLRFNEQLGLSLADVFSGAISSKALEDALRPYAMKPYGYISLESQPFSPHQPRAEDGSVPRKPLKNKKSISHENSRIIPIFDKQAFNFLVGVWNAQQFLFSKKKCGENPKNYLLFEGLNKNTYANALRVAQKRLHFEKFFTPHDTRHTYSTWLADQTGGNYTLCRMILGHASLDITLRYTHLSAQIHKNLKVQNQLVAPMTEIG
jgi:integrase